jgi:HK97 gp10 family phage protein
VAQLNPRIVAKLKQIPAVAVDAARLAMEEGAQEIVDAMKAAVHVLSGDLRDSIGWTWDELPPGTFMIDEIRSGKNKGDQYATLRIKIYAGNKDAFYARFIEFGTAPHSLELNASVARANSGSGINQRRQQSSKQHPGQPAQPFFYVTWSKEKAKFRRRIRDRIRKRIREAWRNG